MGVGGESVENNPSTLYSMCFLYSYVFDEMINNARA